MLIFDEKYYITQIFLVLNITIIMSSILVFNLKKIIFTQCKKAISNENTNEDNNRNSDTSINKCIEVIENILCKILQILETNSTEDKKIYLNIHLISEKNTSYLKTKESKIDENNEISINQSRIQDLKQDYLYHKDPDIQVLTDESTDERSKKKNIRRTRQVK